MTSLCYTTLNDRTTTLRGTSTHRRERRITRRGKREKGGGSRIFFIKRTNLKRTTKAKGTSFDKREQKEKNKKKANKKNKRRKKERAKMKKRGGDKCLKDTRHLNFLLLRGESDGISESDDETPPAHKREESEHFFPRPHFIQKPAGYFLKFEKTRGPFNHSIEKSFFLLILAPYYLEKQSFICQS